MVGPGPLEGPLKCFDQGQARQGTACHRLRQGQQFPQRFPEGRQDELIIGGKGKATVQRLFEHGGPLRGQTGAGEAGPEAGQGFHGGQQSAQPRPLPLRKGHGSESGKDPLHPPGHGAEE